MKTALILAALFFAFGFAGAVDYQIEAGMQAERTAAAGGLRHAAR